MTTIYLELLILLLLLLVNGALAMSEIAVVSARKVRLRQRAESGDTGARLALELARQPTQFLSTVQVGITLVGILAGAFGGATIAEELEAVFSQMPRLAAYSEALGVGIVVLFTTYLSLIIGELVPKQIALSNPERVAALVAPFMKRLARLTRPVVTVLSLSSNALLRLLGVRPASGLETTEEEIRILIKQATREGVFEPIEEEMIAEVIRLGDLKVNALMTPRLDVDWLDIEAGVETIRTRLETTDHTHYPVCQGDLDKVLGIVAAKDVLAQCLGEDRLDLTGIVQPALFVPESMAVFDVIERYKATRSHLALVIDEFGSVQGLVTTIDLLEAIAGDFPEPGEEEDADVQLRADGSWLVDGLLPVEKFRDYLNMGELPGEKENHFQTVGGFVMAQLGRIPTPGDYFEFDRFRIEVVDMDGYRVDKILLTPRGDTPDTPPA